MNRSIIHSKLEAMKQNGEEWDLKFKKVRYITDNNRSFFAIFQSGTIIFKTEDREWLIDEIESIVKSNEKHDMMLQQINEHFDTITDEEFEKNMIQAGFRKKGEFEELGKVETTDGTFVLEYDKVHHTIDLISENKHDVVSQTLSNEAMTQLQQLLTKGINIL